MKLDEPWARITAWLTVNAPVSAAQIRPPAPTAELADARAAFDRPWPDDLVRLYELCDGSSDATRDGARLLALMVVVPLDYMLQARQTNLEVAAEFPPDPNDESEEASTTAEPHDVWTWSSRMVPFAEDVGGDGLFVDLRDGPAFGSVGRWLHADNRTAAVWPSLTALFVEVADALQNGTAWDRWWHPFVNEEGRLDWDPS